MASTKRSLFLGVFAVLSIGFGALIAWVWGRSDINAEPEQIPVQPVIATDDPDEIFSAPDIRPDGSIKSLVTAWPNGGDRAVEYRNKQGEVTARQKFTASGKVELEILYRQEGGLQIGVERGWYPSGELQYRCEKADGQLHGAYAEFWPTGYQKASGHYKQGKRQGTWHFWSNRGLRIETISFENDILQGPYQKWNKFGMPLIKGSYDHGEQSGEWIYYNQTGDGQDEIIQYPANQGGESK